MQVRPSHDADDDRQNEVIETSSIGGKGTGTTDASAILAILDAAPAIWAGTQGAGQHLDMIDKKLVFLLEPAKRGPGRTVGFSERSTEPRPSLHLRQQVFGRLGRYILHTPRSTAQKLKCGDNVAEIWNCVTRHVRFSLLLPSEASPRVTDEWYQWSHYRPGA